MGRRKKIEQELLRDPLASQEARGERVRRLRNLANLTRLQMCEDCDINVNSLKGWEIGRYGGLTSYGAEKIISRVAMEGVLCSLEWLMYGMGSGPSIPTTMVYPTAQSSNPKTEDEKIQDELVLLKQQYQGIINIIVDDEGMLPFYSIGDYLAGQELSFEKLSQAINQNCIVEKEDGKFIVRQVRAGSLPNTYTLVSLNNAISIQEPIIYNVKLRTIAPVIWHRKKNNFN